MFLLNNLNKELKKGYLNKNDINFLFKIDEDLKSSNITFDVNLFCFKHINTLTTKFKNDNDNNDNNDFPFDEIDTITTKFKNENDNNFPFDEIDIPTQNNNDLKNNSIEILQKEYQHKIENFEKKELEYQQKIKNLENELLEYKNKYYQKCEELKNYLSNINVNLDTSKKENYNKAKNNNQNELLEFPIYKNCIDLDELECNTIYTIKEIKKIIYRKNTHYLFFLKKCFDNMS